ncbi:YbeD family protein [Stratiformator vulcanicus]|uniref:Uncharacterized protein n=1 Tax=Stratiformator vulcanicus TaxID=2527980 RepID=A0A517R2K0_9PLAN|nr:DUF493 domain-containing protein [Stratiformator vulcanicus]QDT38088.1 hypothetical protein Pan189_24780 [Stratiformator vulcanicus]
MPDLPPVDLLEDTHDFPCPYLFKVIGEDDRAFAARVVSLVRETVGLDEDPEFKIRRTTSGRHLSVTIEPVVEHANQVLEIYDGLSRLKGLVMVM